MLNAREITRNSTKNLNENILLNVIEEISIASNIPAPPVFVLHDNSINAFVAGNSYEDAIICVTQGAIDKLDREELQGVIAHEFSHIFNGDMELNIKAIGILYGILAISTIGIQMIRGASNIRGNSKNDSGASGYFIFFGIALYLVGSIGVFFANIIKAAINRQREYLADASAVQFTRNPDGIGNALKKIGYYGSKIDAPDANEFSHLYIEDGIKSIFSFLTHPPLNERIRRIDKSWGGNFDLFIAETKAKKRQKEKTRNDQIVKTITTAAVLSSINNIGDISDEQIKDARKELSSIPKETYYSIDNPLEAGLTIFCMLLDKNPNIKTSQIEIIKNNYKMDITPNLLHVDSITEKYKREEYLKIILICINTLKLMVLFIPNNYYKFYAKNLST
jgi:Zn-dependent protease with chaperone function